MNRMIAEDQRLEMERNLTDAKGAAERARRDLQQMVAERDGFEQRWKAKVSQDFTLCTRNLSDASESLDRRRFSASLLTCAPTRTRWSTVAKVLVGSAMEPAIRRAADYACTD